MFLRLLSSILYTVEGVTPDKFASSFNVIPWALQISKNLETTVALTLIIFSPMGNNTNIYAIAYTLQRNKLFNKKESIIDREC